MQKIQRNLLALLALLLLGGCVSKSQYKKEMALIDDNFKVTLEFMKTVQGAFDRQDRYDARLQERVEKLEQMMGESKEREQRSRGSNLHFSTAPLHLTPGDNRPHYNFLTGEWE